MWQTNKSCASAVPFSPSLSLALPARARALIGICITCICMTVQQPEGENPKKNPLCGSFTRPRQWHAHSPHSYAAASQMQDMLLYPTHASTIYNSSFFFTSFVCFGRTENTQLPTNDDVELCAGIIFSGSYDKKNRFSISRFSKARASTHMRCDSCVSQRCQRISCFFFLHVRCNARKLTHKS